MSMPFVLCMNEYDGVCRVLVFIMVGGVIVIYTNHVSCYKSNQKLKFPNKVYNSNTPQKLLMYG